VWIIFLFIYTRDVLNNLKYHYNGKIYMFLYVYKVKYKNAYTVEFITCA